MQATLASKGQITLPNKLRDLMHLRKGDKVEFVVDENGNVMMIPMTSPITRLKDMAPAPKNAVSLEDMEAAIAEGGRGYMIGLDINVLTALSFRMIPGRPRLQPA